jgi:hypothetical protein
MEDEIMKQRMAVLIGIVLISVLGFTTSTEAVWLWGRTHHSTSSARLADARPKMRHERLVGRVESVRGPVAYVRVPSGRRVRVLMGPESYWEYRGYELRPGAEVSVYGWSDPGESSDLFFAGSISGPGFSFSLTNGAGVPVWVTDYEYTSGWYPTYDVYERWYGPSYHYVRPAPRVIHVRERDDDRDHVHYAKQEQRHDEGKAHRGKEHRHVDRGRHGAER